MAKLLNSRLRELLQWNNTFFIDQITFLTARPEAYFWKRNSLILINDLLTFQHPIKGAATFKSQIKGN